MMDSVRRLVRLQFPAHVAAVAAVAAAAARGAGTVGARRHTTTEHRPHFHLLVLVVLVLGPHRGKLQQVPERSERPPAAEVAEAAERSLERRRRRRPELPCVDRGGGRLFRVWRLFMSVGDFWIALGACARQVGARRRTSGGLGDPRKSRRRMAWGWVH